MKKFNKQLILLFMLVFVGAVFSQEKEKLATQTFAYGSADPHLDDPDYWQANLDAVIAAPDNHKILMENDKVRVLEVTLAPGETEEVHHHKWPSVLYIQEAGDFIDYDSDGNIIMDSRQIKPTLQFPMIMWKDAEAAHSVENLSKTITIRLIRVEIKQ
ncbi:MAG: hypothetical protein RQ864_01000 [Lutibacter sp.]|nr:hypothetical protein [Lutibacter sp.]